LGRDKPGPYVGEGERSAVCPPDYTNLERNFRLEQGNYGDCEPVGEGISELRMFFGPGYRVYFGEDANNIVVLLCGGDKRNQNQDIKDAKAYWKEYLEDAKL